MSCPLTNPIGKINELPVHSWFLTATVLSGAHTVLHWILLQCSHFTEEEVDALTCDPMCSHHPANTVRCHPPGDKVLLEAAAYTACSLLRRTAVTHRFLESTQSCGFNPQVSADLCDRVTSTHKANESISSMNSWDSNWLPIKLSPSTGKRSL